jgi:hypothetical protein
MYTPTTEAIWHLHAIVCVDSVPAASIPQGPAPRTQRKSRHRRWSQDYTLSSKGKRATHTPPHASRSLFTRLSVDNLPAPLHLRLPQPHLYPMTAVRRPVRQWTGQAPWNRHKA